jgi:hypothetical protein
MSHGASVLPALLAALLLGCAGHEGPAEQHQLTLYRVVPDGQLKRTPDVSTPVELLVVGGSVVDKRTGRDDTSSLLSRFQ